VSLGGVVSSINYNWQDLAAAGSTPC